MPGETGVFSSDGITEALDPAAQVFGYARLQEVVEASADRPAAATMRAILAAVTAFAAGTPFGDDVSLLGLRGRP